MDELKKPSGRRGSEDTAVAQPTPNIFTKPFSEEVAAKAAAEHRAQGHLSSAAGGLDTTSMVGRAEGEGVGFGAPKLSADYYQQWRADAAAKVERGEDPYADFERRAREQHDNTLLGRMSKGVKGMMRRGSKEEGREGKPGPGGSQGDDGVVR